MDLWVQDHIGEAKRWFLPADEKAAASNPASSFAIALSPRLAAAPTHAVFARSSPVFCGNTRRAGGAGENQADGGGLRDSSKAVSLPPTYILVSSPERCCCRSVHARSPELCCCRATHARSLELCCCENSPRQGSRAPLQISRRHVSRTKWQFSPRHVSRALPLYSPSLPQPPPHAAEDVGRGTAQVVGGPGDALAPAHATEGLGDTSVPAHATEGLGDASAPGLKAFQGLSERLVLVLVPEPCDEDEPSSDPVPERFKEKLVLIVASEARYEEFKEEVPPDPVSEGFKEQLVLVLASEGPPDSPSASEGPPDSASVPVSEGPVGSVPVSEGPAGSFPFSEGSPGTVKAKPDSKPDCKPDSKPPEFHRVSGGSSTLHGRPPDLPSRGSSTLLCRPPDRFLINLQVPADIGLHSLYVSAVLLVFAFAAVAGRQGLYVSAGLLVFAFAVGRHGLCVSVVLHVSAADRQGLQVLILAFIATAGLHVFAEVAGRPGS
ncbi:hypothetical protein CRENBAI_003181 [Crenichthys baileyi]|uniref:Uncharacterized protein n=1 Tax=Crenichthys baileyi TaxID=28760 RepID=A0AAV9RZ80_9TELE